MGSQYTVIAEFYDRLNRDVDYGGYADFILSAMQKHGISEPSPLVLDLGCGTGNITLALEERGCDMIGIDSSEEMLAIAAEKSYGAEERRKVLLLRQDMCDFELYGTVRAAVSCLDSLNYLTDTNALRRCFSLVHNYLDPDGLFIFDMNTPFKFRHIYGNNAYVLEDEGIYCGWQNDYSEKTGICRFYLSFFAEEPDGSYSRYDEEQKERCYSARTVNKLLDECGFEVSEVCAGYNFAPVDEQTERWYYICRKK